MSSILRQAASIVSIVEEGYLQVKNADNIWLGPPVGVQTRFRVVCSVTQGYVVHLLANTPLIPNTPADLVQDLYIREIKAYKPAPAVSAGHMYNWVDMSPKRKVIDNYSG